MLATLVLLTSGAGGAGWSVTFEETDLCAPLGASVEIGCSYDYTAGETVQQTAWHKGRLQRGLWTRVALADLPSFQNRSEYLGDRRHDCGLAIHDLRVNDSGHYYFWFDTETFGRRSQGSVYLTVTADAELSASVLPASVRAGDHVTLTCLTSCHPATTVWFKDGLPVARTQFQARAEDSGNYVCAVKGVESVLSDPVALDVQYPPLNVSVEMSSSASGVNLTCSGAANPAADRYTWYRGAGSSPGPLLEVGSGRVLSLASGGAAHAGLDYRCRASNHLGGSYSPGPPVTPDSTDISRVVLCVGIGVKSFVLLFLPLVIIWRLRRKPAAHKEESCDYENVITV